MRDADGNVIEVRSDYTFTGYRLPAEVSPDERAAAAEALPAWERACEGVGLDDAGWIDRELARLWGLTKKRAEGGTDLKIIAAAWREELAAYPPDVVVYALREWPKRSPWWPAWKEIYDLLEAVVLFRRSTRDALRTLAALPPPSQSPERQREPDWQPPTDEECARFSALMAELRQKLTVEEAAQPAKRAAVPVSRERTPEERAAARAAIRASAERLGLPLRSADDAAAELAPAREPETER